MINTPQASRGRTLMKIIQQPGIPPTYAQRGGGIPDVDQDKGDHDLHTLPDMSGYNTNTPKALTCGNTTMEDPHLGSTYIDVRSTSLHSHTTTQGATPLREVWG